VHFAGSGVYLPRPGDAGGAVVVDFFPVGDPAGQSSDSEHDGEHIGGDADGAEDESAIEIDVGVEFSLDEVGVFEGTCFEFDGDIEEGVGVVELGEEFFASLFEDACSGVVVFVDTMAKAHESEGTVLLFGQFEAFFDVEVAVVNFL